MPKLGIHGTHRKFGSFHYHHVCDRTTKREAKKEAKKYRQGGKFSARITRNKGSYSVWSFGTTKRYGKWGKKHG